MKCRRNDQQLNEHIHTNVQYINTTYARTYVYKMQCTPYVALHRKHLRNGWNNIIQKKKEQGKEKRKKAAHERNSEFYDRENVYVIETIYCALSLSGLCEKTDFFPR